VNEIYNITEIESSAKLETKLLQKYKEVVEDLTSTRDKNIS